MLKYTGGNRSCKKRMVLIHLTRDKIRKVRDKTMDDKLIRGKVKTLLVYKISSVPKLLKPTFGYQ